MQIKDYLDRFELLFPDSEKLKDYRRAYNDKDLSSIFRLLDNDELRKAVMEENLHSIFRLLDSKSMKNTELDKEDFRKSVLEKNLHSVFRTLEKSPTKQAQLNLDDFRKAVVENNLRSILRIFEEAIEDPNLNVTDFRKAVMDNNLHSIFRFFDYDDLRKAVIDKNLDCIFRIEPNEDLRKLIFEDNYKVLWEILTENARTTFVQTLKFIYNNKIEFDYNSFSQGQIKSKIWLIQELKKLNLNLGTVFLCAGWYATLATLLFENDFQITKIRSFDVDSNCADMADRFNKPWVLQDWKFKSSTKNILDINYDVDMYQVKKSDGTLETCKDRPDTIINTSCEHIENFSEWYSKIPIGKLVILQTNNYFDINDHVNCSKDLEEFSKNTPMSKTLYEGELDLSRYKRFMRIGYR